MKRFENIIKPVLFIFILLVIINLLSIVFIPKDNTKEAGMPEFRPNGILSEPKNTIDVLVIGDSESYTSFSPMEIWSEYGYTSYVMGSNAQKIYQSYNYLLLALETQHPKVVVLETNTFYRKLKNDLKIISFLERHIPFIKYHDRWKTLNWNDFYADVNYTNRNDLKGYYFIRYSQPYKESKPVYMFKKDKREALPKDDEYYIRKIYDVCKKNDIELMFYTAPQIKNWWYSKYNTIRDLAKDLGINYVDTNLVSEIDIDWVTDTKDVGDHVNYYGAKKVSHYMGKYLGEKYNLVDHRDDPDYASWNDSLEFYNSIVADESIIKY